MHRRTHLQDITATGATRELKEEINYIHHGQFEFDRVISTYEDDTSVMHIGLPLELHLSPEPDAKTWDVDGIHNTFSNLKFEEAEFPGIEWMTKEELKKALEGEDIDDIKAKSETLSEIAQNLAVKLYEQANAAQGEAGQATDAQEAPKDDNTFDGDFEESK